MPAEINVAPLKSSVQNPTFDKNTLYGINAYFIPPVGDNAYLAPYSTPRREWQLREYYRAMYNTLFSSVVVNLANEIAATPWQLYGKRNRNYYHDLLTQADLGAGWRSFCSKIVQARAVNDIGACVEVIGRGDASKPIAGRVEGFAVLDPIWTELTGNLQYPAIYRSTTGEFHRLEYSRFYRFVDSPQTDREAYGRGFSALSRYFWHTQRQIMMGRYSLEKLSDLPQGGAVLANNIVDYQTALKQYEANRSADGLSVYRPPIVLEAYEPGEPMSVQFISFRELPDGFDYEKYLKDDEIAVARALGIDFQDVTPLSGQSFGTGAQSYILDVKSKRKTQALIYADIETFINFYILPPYLEFKFVEQDINGQKSEAEIAQLWVNVANTMPGLSIEQRLQLIANNVQSVRDIVTDQDGNLNFVDTDKPPPLEDTTTPGTDITVDTAESTTTEGEQPQSDAPVTGGFKYNAAGIAIPQAQVYGYDIDAGVVTLDEARAAKGLPPSEDVPEDELQQLQSKAAVMLTLTQAQVPMEQAAEMVGISVPARDAPEVVPSPPVPPNPQMPPQTPSTVEIPMDDTEQERVFHAKAYQATRLDYESDISNLINAAVAGDVTRVRFGIAFRGITEKYGRKAMLDGLGDGGVDASVLEGDDLDTFKAWQREQSKYISDIGDAIYKGGIQYTGDARGNIWANKSLNGIYQKGLLSADANGVYTWVIGPTEEHCADCSRYNGQAKRLKTWHEKEMLPQSSALSCHGYNCKCRIVRRRGRTRNS